MLKQQTVTQGELTFTMTALPALEGRRAFVKLMRLLAPALGAAASLEIKTGSEVGVLITRLFESVSEDDFEYFYKLFEKNTQIKAEKGFVPMANEALQFSAFQCDYLAMLNWLRAHLEFNFGSVLKGISATQGPA